MNKKVLVSLAALVTAAFTSLGAVSANAASNCTIDTQSANGLQIQSLTKADIEKLQLSLEGLVQKRPCAENPNSDNSTPEVEAPETDNSTPEVETPDTDSSTPEINNPSEDEKPSTSTEVSAFEQKVLELTNVERTKAGLSPLTLDTELSKVARIKSQDMKDQNYFSHTSPTYGSPFDMMKTFGISYTSAAENIAQGQTSPEAVVEAWMNSQGHRENILNAKYTHIGIGHVSDGNYWTQMFIGK